jgi:hypothetical protein
MEIFKGSQPSYRSELDLSSIPSSDVSLLHSEYFQYYPVFNLKDSSNPVQFIIPSTGTHYTQLSDSFLYLRLRILKTDGSNLTSAESVAGTNNLFAALFESAEIMLNSTIVSKSASLYPYKAHILDLLTKDSGYKNTFMGEQLFYPDEKLNDHTASIAGFLTRINNTR